MTGRDGGHAMAGRADTTADAVMTARAIETEARPSGMPAMESPPNLHICVTSRASTAAPLRERVEQKFFITPDRITAALALLRRISRPDPEYPVGQVNSLYFDTFDLEEHARSDAGDSAKDKIRIRWYGDELDPHSTSGVKAAPVPAGLSTDETGAAAEPAAPGTPVSVWLERKTRQGFASTKQRISLDVPSSALAFAALGRGIVPPAVLLDTMASFGFFPRGPLCPVIAISYWRHRFVEPSTGFRMSIDSRIRSSLVMLGIGRGERGLELPGAVVEVKGAVFDLPPALRVLGDIGSSWTRYSKYSSSLDGHAATLGSVSRLWPAGMMESQPGMLARVGKRAGAQIVERPVGQATTE
jgi:hypothetical protein